MRDKERAGSRTEPEEKNGRKKSSYYRRLQKEDAKGQEPEAFSFASGSEAGGSEEPGRLHFTPSDQLEQNAAKAETPGKEAGNNRFRFRDQELDSEERTSAGTAPEDEAKTDTGQTDSHQQRRADRAKNKEEKTDAKLKQAREDLPTRRSVRLEREFDPETGKNVHQLRFEKEVKPQGRKSKLAGGALAAGRMVDLKVHQKIREVEHENVGVEAVHKTEFTAEQLAAHGVRSAYRHHKVAPYLRVKKLEQKTAKAHVNYLYQQAILKHPEAASNPLSRFQQKRRIKQHYAKELRKAKKQAENTATGAKKATDIVGGTVQMFRSFVTEHKGVLLVIGVFLLIFILFSSLFSSCSVLLQNGAGALLASSYTAEDSSILGANTDYSQLEKDLQSKIANIESTHPGYDEYRYSVEEINHNPHELISYLTVKNEAFTRSEVQAALAALFAKQYMLTLREEMEIRYRTETSTDPDTGETTSEEVAYEYYILNVSLTNKGLGAVILPELTADERERCTLLLQTRGNKPYLFGDDIYANPTEGEQYKIPGEALSDPSFAALIKEAEKYLGYPYVWGGSSPSTSFDCSGFVCWVFSNSSVHNLPRTTAQGIYNQCAHVSAADAKPGDIIFFTGTYASSGPVSHVGIYVGGGMMIHCGSPIQYANINSSYWQQHFYAFGRL